MVRCFGAKIHSHGIFNGEFAYILPAFITMSLLLLLAACLKTIEDVKVVIY